MKNRVVRLRDVASLNISNRRQNEKKIAYLDTGNIIENRVIKIQYFDYLDNIPSRAKRKVKEEDTIFSMVRPNQKHFGYINRSMENLIVSTGFSVVTPNKNKINSRYLFYLLTNNEVINIFQKLAEGCVSTYPTLSLRDLLDFEFKLPSLEEQKRIADILTALDDKIELNNQMNQTLEEIASLLYKRWFVDFEFPDDKGNPYKSSDGEMVDSELGMIPKGWEVKSLTEVAKFVNGLAMQKFRPQINEESLPVLKIKELISNSVSKSTERCKKNIKDEVKVFDGDIIFSWSGTLAVKIWSGGDAGLNQHLFKVSSSIYPKWLYYLIVLYNLNNFKSIASDKATTMGHINRSHLEKTYFTIPQIKIINKEYTYMKTLIDKIIENKVSIKYLQETKEKLMLDIIKI